MFQFFTSSVLFAEQSFDVACRCIAHVGLREVDIWSIRGWCEHIPPDQESPRWKPIRDTLAKHGLRCRAFSLYGASPERIQSRLPALQALGGSVLVTGSGSPQQSVAEFARTIRPLADQARDLNVTLAIENHNNAVIDSIASMVELCERIDHSGLGIALAPIHLHRRGESIPDAIRTLGREKIALFYAWDWGPTAEEDWKDPQQQIPGTGVLDFPAILQALRDIEYDRPLCLFAHGVEHRTPEYGMSALQRGIAYLQRLERQLGAS